jgi:hypothetical protein
LGATGRLEIIAPVVAAGEFSWPPDVIASGLIEFDAPVVRYFDASSRIMLFPSDLAKIEAVGWAIPWRFYSPRHAQEAIKQAPRDFEDSLTARHERRTRATPNFVERFPELNKRLLERNSDGKFELTTAVARPGSLEFDREGIESLRETALDLPWTMVEAFDEKTERTTVEHLFISRDEFLRLRDGTPQIKNLPQPELNPPTSEHGNTGHNYRKKYQVLLAAIWVHRKAIKDIAKSAPEWTRKIETEAAYSFWPEKNAPPVGYRKIEETLRLALREDCGTVLNTKTDQIEHNKN